MDADESGGFHTISLSVLAFHDLNIFEKGGEITGHSLNCSSCYFVIPYRVLQYFI